MTGPNPSPAARPLTDFWVFRALRTAEPAVAATLDGPAVATAAEAWARVGTALGMPEGDVARRLAPVAHVPVANLGDPDTRLVTFLPETVARKYGIVPLRADGRTIWIATADPVDINVEQAVAFVTSRDVAMELAGPLEIQRAFEAIYQPANAVNRLVDNLPVASVETIDETPPPDTPGIDRDPALDAPVARLIDAILSDAVTDGASDIHIEPIVSGVAVRYRIDGILKEVMKMPPTTGPSVVRRIKILSRMDVTNSMRPQDGRMAVKVDGQQIDLRVSTVPIARRGEKVVIRILDKRHLKFDLKSIGLLHDELAALEQLLGRREGMILVTGPTGSGKTTTLYGAINQLKTGKVNITTVEDPVEYDVPDIAQIQVNEAQGLTFASTLRSVLRQDPDVVLVGEIRDAETAQIAVQASMTGHLVLSTLHTNDAPSAALRMKDMGIEGFKLAGTLLGVVAQRLVRRVCEACAQPVPIGDLPSEARPPKGVTATPLRGAGCKECRGSGYRGRQPIVEIMINDAAVAKEIDRGTSGLAIASAARKSGMRTLRESGLARVWAGTTTYDEVQRVIGETQAEEEPPPPADEPVPEPEAPPAAAPVATRPAPPAEPAAPAKRGAAKAGATAKAAAAAKAAPATKTAKKKKGAAPAPPAAPHVLIVDDDPQMRRFVRSVLEREQFTVEEAEDGLQALDAIERRRPDIVLLDLDMPRLDGTGTLEELRAGVQTATLPVVMLTARTEDEADLLDKGANDFIAKPLQPRALAARVRAVLRRAES